MSDTLHINSSGAGSFIVDVPNRPFHGCPMDVVGPVIAQARTLRSEIETAVYDQKQGVEKLIARAQRWWNEEPKNYEAHLAEVKADPYLVKSEDFCRHAFVRAANSVFAHHAASGADLSVENTNALTAEQVGFSNSVIRDLNKPGADNLPFIAVYNEYPRAPGSEAVAPKKVYGFARPNEDGSSHTGFAPTTGSAISGVVPVLDAMGLGQR